MEQVFKINRRKVKVSPLKKNEFLIKRTGLTKEQFERLKSSGKIYVMNSELHETCIYEITHVRRKHNSQIVQVIVKSRDVEPIKMKSYHLLKNSSAIQSN